MSHFVLKLLAGVSAVLFALIGLFFIAMGFLGIWLPEAPAFILVGLIFWGVTVYALIILFRSGNGSTGKTE